MICAQKQPCFALTNVPFLSKNHRFTTKKPAVWLSFVNMLYQATGLMATFFLFHHKIRT